jgi:hypothetical protein
LFVNHSRPKIFKLIFQGTYESKVEREGRSLGRNAPGSRSKSIPADQNKKSLSNRKGKCHLLLGMVTTK